MVSGGLKMVLGGLRRSQVVLDGLRWSQEVSGGLRRSQVVLDGLRWSWVEKTP